MSDRVVCVVCGWKGCRELCTHEEREGDVIRLKVHHGRHCGKLVKVIADPRIEHEARRRWPMSKPNPLTVLAHEAADAAVPEE